MSNILYAISGHFIQARMGLMRKLSALFFIFCCSTAAFAQLKMSFTADFNPELFRFGIPLGAAARQDGSFQGTYDAFSSSGNETLGRENELLLGLNFTGKGYAAYLQANFSALVMPYDEDSAPATVGFVVGEGMPPVVSALLAAVFDEWYVQGTAKFLSGYVGNTNDRGKVKRFQNFDEYLPTIIKSYGVNTPDPRSNRDTYLTFQSCDNNNFLRQQRTEGRYYYHDQPYFSVSLNFADLVKVPLTLQLMGDVGYNAGVIDPDGSGGDDDSGGSIIAKDYYKMNGGIRVSGEKIANLVTFDAIYKFRGGGPNTIENEKATQPVGAGVTGHSFGVYANLLNLAEGLGIGLGYTGLLRVYDDRDLSHASGVAWESRIGPFFSGIDLRFQYTQIKDFTFTLSNNVSIGRSGIGSDDGTIQAMSFRGRPLAIKTEESWLALHNALGIDYKISKALTAQIQAGNNLGIYGKTTNGSKDQTSRNMFGATAFVVYAFNKSVTFQSGLELLIDSVFKRPPSGEKIDSGIAYLALPVRMKISF